MTNLTLFFKFHKIQLNTLLFVESVSQECGIINGFLGADYGIYVYF